jgi:pimeloyl-ACP methyl ester carboxylesterase
MPPKFVQGNINGISYGFIETHNSSDRILIFLPGIGACKESYIEHISEFHDYYSMMYILDLPEQGSKGFWQIGVMVEMLAEFIGNIDTPLIRRIDLGGHSAGALAAFSFIANYNSRVEKRIMEAVKSVDSTDKIKSVTDLNGTGFANPIPEMGKVENLLLYAPPDSFDYVFDRLYSIGLSKRSEKFVRKLLNVVVNRPMIFMRFFSATPYFRFRIDKSGRPQYFKLIINDYIRFLNYTSGYQTIFELFRFLDQAYRNKVIERLSEKQILIQYGSNDWVIKPFKKRTPGFSEGLKIADGINIVRHRFLGHMLNSRFRPDINLNLQMVLNQEVISESVRFINK